MKKRMALFTAVLLAAALCAAMFAGCISSGNRNRDRDGNNPDAKKYTVTFNTGGGSAIASITADSGTIINKPADPARAGYAFDGWYTSAQYTRSVNFPFTLTQNVALYAKWTGSGGVEKAVLEIAVATPPSKTTYNAGETFNDAGLTLVVLYTDGSVVTITSGWALDKSPSDPLAPDDFYVVITFGGKTVPQSITVMPSNQSVWDIEIFAKPIKTQYTVGETFDTAGMVLRVTYADG
ncbi:MAG: InlB B-repeat-containing protein, partial [Firmicutes bacterium]|nr:InlB B-repeat-containing protein [Bacillota bacterium]